MNRKEKIVDQMELLGIQDVTTNRQHRNGTVVWRLPIKYSTHNSFIEVASFKSGYVRNQNGGYTNYQLNKRCESGPQYYPDYEHTKIDGEWVATKTGKYNKYTTRGCVMIPNEIDRLEYLITYCLKNYYIKLANQVVDGKYIPKWELEHALARNNNDGTARWRDSEVNDCGHYHRIQELEEKLEMTQNEYNNRSIHVNELQEKLDAMTDDRDVFCNRVYELESQVNVEDNRVASLSTELKVAKNKLALIEEWAGDIKRTAKLYENYG